MPPRTLLLIERNRYMNMLLKDFKVGDHVRIYVDANNRLEPADAESGAGTIACHIIAIRYEDIMVGWKLGESQPLGNNAVSIRYAKVEGNSYPGFVAWVILSRIRRSPGLVLTDGPCRQCSKKNSSLDKKCWWCLVSCPTDLKRTGP